MNGGDRRRNALVLYGTETGTAQDLAEELGRVTECLRFSTRIAELDTVSFNLLSSFTITIFVISTTGQGEFPSNAKTFWTSLLKKRLSATLLQDVCFFLLGLGDTSYPKFNWAARKLGKRLKQLGAVEVIDSCEADEQGEDSTDGAFLAWLPLFKAALLEQYPLPDGLQSIPDDQPLPSKWVLESAPTLINGHKIDISRLDDCDDRSEREISNDNVSTLDADKYSRPLPDSFPVLVEKNTRLTPSSHWQDVRLLSLITNQAINYLPGDALSIMPENVSEDVTKLIHLMDWTSVADHPVLVVPSSKHVDLTEYPPCPISDCLASTTSLTLRDLLTAYLDITSIPRRSLFSTLARYTNDPTQRERLIEFTLPQYLDEYYDYATRPRRSILEILQEFDSVKIPWQEAANVFPLLRGRQFSISSGGKLRKLSEDENSQGTRFELLVAIVKYKTIMKKTRQGVCTRYLASLPQGSTINVIHRTDGRFSTKSSRPTINPTTHSTNPSLHPPPPLLLPPKLLIGAGTGLAPLRALIHSDEQDALLHDQHTASPPTTLIFGCRHPDNDFFFADEWAARQSQRTDFQLIPAFSRAQPRKVYVQDRLREHGAHVYDLLVRRGAVVVVCGSSGAMPKAVRQALVDVLVAEGKGKLEDGDGGEGWTVEEAERYLAGLEKERRYIQETW